MTKLVYAMCKVVSIHAPTRGATSRMYQGASPQLFQSTPPRGGRPTSPTLPRAIPCFNPRPHEGGDIKEDEQRSRDEKFQSTPPRGGRLTSHAYYSDYDKVSIHAPTRGATIEIHERDASNLVSIHAPTRGATAVELITDARGAFQSTPPRGGRHDTHFCLRQLRVVSIHAPTRGATCCRLYTVERKKVSIHAPTRGAT